MNNFLKLKAPSLGWLTALILIFCIHLPSKAQKSSKPNVLIILADDMGYGDLQSFNDESLVPTPNLDQLASEGIRLTDAYCPVSVCSPSRYALMTGTYPWRSRKKKGVMANYEPSMIESSQLTLPEMLQQAGYHTAGFGKWHLGTSFPTLDGEKPAGYGKFKAENNGANLDLSKPVHDGPLDHGFDRWLGFSCASECWILDDNEIMGAIGHDLYTIESTPNKDHIKEIPLEDYLPYITEHSISYLEDYAKSEQDKPFFLYYAPYVPHIPLSVSQEFRGKTPAGLYGDYVHELDHYVGKVLKQLDDLDLSDNTIIIFASDNGSQFKGTSKKMDMTSASNSPADNKGEVEDKDAHQPNGKLRGTKWTPWEGGVRTPVIARWPGQFPEGAVSSELFALNDVIATLAAIIEYPLSSDQAVDSYDLLPVLKGEKKQLRKEVVIQASDGTLGLRSGDWKYIGDGRFKTRSKQNTKGELYNLSEDISEANNLYKEQSALAKQLEERLGEIIRSQNSNR
ncbi:sulfatase family protein [Catalinimonas alkaloidigena]|uniref:sulfatase family protein n=1 Tax=Catalinimonas alkaloidigena TaxID=1075417 RepID=UPI002406EBCE|nr:arylsulfatase [Catalinimonas alkaloidigena]